MDLFAQRYQEMLRTTGPLAERLRPVRRQDFVGFNMTSGPWRLVDRALKGEGLSTNLIFWGPPGTGKTSLARLIATTVNAEFKSVNAVDTGAKELKQIGEESRRHRIDLGQSTILFIDEIHRLNKSQQDVLLPFSERGDFVLIGATTENPSYELNSALLSRCQVVRFERLAAEDLKLLIQRAAQAENLNLQEWMDASAQEQLIAYSDGDARRLLNGLDAIIAILRSDDQITKPVTAETLSQVLSAPALGYQRTGDDHYDCISAFIKSVRGSDPSAAVYYLARMLESGEDPVFIARRLVILASEDIGNADPRGLSVAVAGLQAVELVGMPEAAICLSQVTTYLASAPKSNAAYLAIKKAQDVVRQTGRPEIPLSLRSARTPMAKQMGYGKGYLYSHDGPKGYQPQKFLPDAIQNLSFYEPKEIGFEKTIRQYLEWLRQTKPDTSGN